MKSSSVAGIILAAGKSRRMGKNKLLLSYKDKPIVQHVIDAAMASPLHPLFLVMAEEAPAFANHINAGSCTPVYHSRTAYSDSLKAGLAAACKKQCPGAMFLLGDQPLVTVDTITRLIQAFKREPQRWVAPLWQGQRGNPVIAPRSWFDRIFTLTGDTGPRHFLQHPDACLKLVEVNDPGVIYDIDTPDDYHWLQGIKKLPTAKAIGSHSTTG
jgi:molybdenum cofactor cytidylyltransferase